MPIDASIPLGIKPVQIESPLNQLGQVLSVQSAQNQNALAQYGLARAQRQDDETNKLAQLMSGGGVDLSTPEGQAKAYGVAPTQAAGYIKGMLENKNIQAQTGQRTAQGDKDRVEAENKTISVYRDASQSITDPQSAIDFVTHMHSDPRLANSPIAQVPLEKAIAQIPQDPAQLAAWKQQFALGATKFMELNKPQTTVVNAGGSSQVLQTPGLGGQPQLVGTVAHTVSPDAQLQANTSTANNQRIIAAENLRAGVTPGGVLDDNTERTAQAIAAGQLPAPTGAALLSPRNRMILGRVMEINPNYDATTVSAKKTAAAAFTSGPLGNALRSVSTANAHLDQLNDLVDAMGNGNTQVVNKVQNYFSQQTGNPNVTNFDAIKAVVGQEVVKAIVAGGGGVGEREEAAKIFSSANSPAQLKGAIQHYRMVMGAQANNLLEQRRAAGLPDSTLPNYTTTNNKPQGMPDQNAIDAELARRAGNK